MPNTRPIAITFNEHRALLQALQGAARRRPARLRHRPSQDDFIQHARQHRITIWLATGRPPATATPPQQPTRKEQL